MSRAVEVKNLRDEGMSYGKIATALKMSKRDVAKILTGTITVPAAPAPMQAYTPSNDGLAETLRALDWALGDAEKALRQVTADERRIETILGTLRTITSGLRKEFPVPQVVTYPVTLDAIPVDSLAVDPLTLI